MTYDLGVDLGTTYTCAARARDGRIELVQLGHTSPLVPSIVSLRDDDSFVVGEAAERRAVTDPSRTVREFKRRLGDEAPYVIAGKPFGAEALAAQLLASVVAQVRDAEGEPARRIALAHPANYGPFKLGKLQEAAALAGVESPLLVPEPVAAALSYADRERVPTGGHVLVYDLGGGTFDVAVVQMAAGGPEVVGTPDGLERLGGIDFDGAVLNHVDRALDGRVHAADTDNAETRSAIARLRDECRGAKEALSSDTETVIPVLLPGVNENVRLTRAEFEQLLRPRLEDTFPIIERVVTSAGITMADITAILTVGGSSRIPLVGQLLRERTQRPVAIDPNPKASVALGAAAVAAHDAIPGGTDTTAVANAAGPPDMLTTATAATGPAKPRARKRRSLVAALVAIVVLGGGVAAFALNGGSGGKHAAKTATSTTHKRRPKPTTTTLGATTTTAVGQSPSGGGGGVAPPPVTNNTAPPPTAPPTTAVALPTINASANSPVLCHPGETTQTVEISWSSTNATSVDVSSLPPGQVPNGSLSAEVSCTTDSPTSATVTAHGPGGDASTSVSWGFLHGTD